MVSRLEKARRNPGSMKGKILAAARRTFGTYGYYGTTTRMIAGDVGIDISTLYYHWGEKNDLYEAVLTDLNKEIHHNLIEVEAIVHGKSLHFLKSLTRMAIMSLKLKLDDCVNCHYYEIICPGFAVYSRMMR